MKRLAVRYWTWLGSALHLTRGGRVLFTLVAGLGLLGVIGDDVTGGVDGPNEAAVFFVWAFLTLLVVVAADGAFRLFRTAASRL